MDVLAIISIALSVLALIPFGAYLFLRLFYYPKILIRVGGDQRGVEPIPIPEIGNIPFAILTKSKLKTLISEVWVSFDDESVNLFETKGVEKRITTDNRFPMAILFTERRIVKAGYLQTNYFD